MSTLSFPVAPPQNGDDLDATVVTQCLEYLLSTLQAYDLSNVIPGSALDDLFAASNSPLQRFIDGYQSFIVSGGLPGGFSGLALTVPAILGATFQSNGIRVGSIGGQSFTVAINQDTYFSVRSTGIINTPQAVANNASAPALPTADSQPLFRVISNGTVITKIVDMRNLTPLKVSPLLTTYTPIVGSITGGVAGTQLGWYLNLGGLKIAFGTSSFSYNSGSSNVHIGGLTLPPDFFNSVFFYAPAIMSEGGYAYQSVSGDSIQGTAPNQAISFYTSNGGTTGSGTVSWLVIGA